ncbi:MAG TPA: hypothetical protein VMT10_14540 [Solirubrobacteraceae bacterium]|nr:hypothetical protein [Solirubrobacteraceae bacterium]
MQRSSLRLRLFCACALALLAAGLSAVGGANADLQGRVSAGQARERALRGAIRADNSHVARYQGRIDDLQQQLSGIQASLDAERQLLGSLQGQLRGARARLVTLRARLARDKQVLARQLVAAYETPQPNLVTVVLDSDGFAALLDRVDGMRMIARENAGVTDTVLTRQQAVRTQAARLAVLEARQQRITDAQLVQRDEVARLRLQIVNQQLVWVRARDRKAAALRGLSARQHGLEQQLARLQAREAASTGAGYGSGPASGVPPVTGSFAPHGGAYGFFQAPGTNYSVGDEPQIAARLDALGKALQLHLIGISGYRTPAHSIEVGGFANDPHTRGQASDTPGVEGVPEATLERFGLERPFPGAAEADHIQLLGSPL